MDYLLQALHVRGQDSVLRAYAQAGVDLGDALDGGAGSGTTAAEMLKSLGPSAIVHAYEPFPGNHRFFEDSDDRIRLKKKALGDSNCTMRLSVPSVVAEESAWGKRGLVGYSSAGHLSTTGDFSEHDVEVECVRADDDLTEAARVGFLKLDLQGGELTALKGMTGFLQRDIALAWIEYGPAFSPPELVDYLIDQNFLLFDTEYLFRGAPGDRALEHFEISREGALSSGSKVWYGFKKAPWGNFGREITQFADTLGLIQTDICCVNRSYLSDFLSAAPHLGAPKT